MSSRAVLIQKTKSGPALAGGRELQISLFAMETIGTVILYWKGVPLYRLLSADPTRYGTHDDTRAWWFSAIVLVQVGYPTVDGPGSVANARKPTVAECLDESLEILRIRCAKLNFIEDI